MYDKDKVIIELAKAAQELATPTDNIIGGVREFCGFVAGVIGEPLEIAVGMFSDKLRYMQWKRQVRFMKESEAQIKDQGLEGKVQPVQMKMAVRILQAASMEEDNDLQDVWVRLLVNAANPDFNHEISPAFATILSDFGPLEARILQTVNDANAWPMRGVYINGLPDVACDEYSERSYKEPSEEVKVAVWNLVRLNCLKHCDPYSNVAITDLGKALIRACTFHGDGDK